jgi:hypothetical protein
MPSADTNAPYTVRKSPLLLVRTAIVFAALVAISVRYHQYWLAGVAAAIYLIGVTHTALSVRVTATDVFVRSLFRTARYSLHEISAVGVVTSGIPALQLQFPIESIKISGLTSRQMSNLCQAISAARAVATQQT